MKTLARSLIFTVIIISAISLIGSVSAIGRDFSQCGNGGCFFYNKSVNLYPKIGVPNVEFNIFMPDFTCNITGTIDSKGNCSVGPLIISDSNFTDFKSNPAVIAVENIQQTNSTVNLNYCPLAYYTVSHEDGYFANIQNETSLIFPNYCYQEVGPVVVPEFGSVAGFVLVISIISLCVFTGFRKL